MNIQDRARKAVKRITGNINGAGVAMTLILPDDSSFDIVGTNTKHHLAVDQETGELTSSMTASISFSEDTTKDAGCNIRNAAGKVDLTGWSVKFIDTTDVLSRYSIEKWFPDEKMGLIVCILGYFKE